jgi:hypothetical protein
MNAGEHLERIKTALILSAAVDAVTILAERAVSAQGYFRARITLVNGDFLEVSEYFLAGPEGCATVEYRHQWMDNARRQLIRRWDNARHFPELANFPHHIHVAGEHDVRPGKAMSIVELLALLEAELT